MACFSIAQPRIGAIIQSPPASVPAATKPARPATVVPVPRDEEWWQQRHAATLERIKKGHVDLLFIGDSITQSWEGEGKDVWAKHYAARDAVNIGFSGDRTQHVLWRLTNGEIDGVAPKLAVVMIGTNNSHDNSAEEIAAGIDAIVKTLRTKLPDTKILLLAIFPRGETAKDNPQRDKNAKASELASHLADGKMIHFLDIGPKFLQADGTMSKEIMPDFLHPSRRGYEIWADAIEPKVKELLSKP